MKVGLIRKGKIRKIVEVDQSHGMNLIRAGLAKTVDKNSKVETVRKEMTDKIEKKYKNMKDDNDKVKNK